ncbi:MAG: hypothetical protein J6066_02415 [Lachnospiraceae bacterium]|nr:hypothetical protein [Lachnospiraceae bacterium]
MGKVDYETFISMLTELNEFINKWDSNYILEVRAIGGFAMIIHKELKHVETPRTESRDIDSLTNDYPEEVIQEIFKIGKKYGADDPDGWLNNHWNKTKEYQEEFEYFIKWQHLELNLSNIVVYYCDLESLLLFKIRAIDDRINLAKLEPRAQDVMDVVSILKAYGEKELSNIKNDRIASSLQYFESAVKYINDITGT